MAIRIGINGFGRIGRLSLSTILNRSFIEPTHEDTVVVSTTTPKWDAIDVFATAPTSVSITFKSRAIKTVFAGISVRLFEPAFAVALESPNNPQPIALQLLPKHVRPAFRNFYDALIRWLCAFYAWLSTSSQSNWLTQNKPSRLFTQKIQLEMIHA